MLLLLEQGVCLPKLFIIDYPESVLRSSCDLNLDNAPNTCETLGDNTLTASFIVA